MKTPLEKIIEMLAPEQEAIKMIAQSMLKEEKEHIIEAYKAGDLNGSRLDGVSGEKYFAQRYERNA